MPFAVTLNIYDVHGHEAAVSINKGLRALGTGAYHAAVEVRGVEWSYGLREEGTGVFDCEPRGCEDGGHKYRESLPMGDTSMSSEEIDALIEKLKGEWKGADYDLLKKNCCSFSNAMCQELGVGPIPSWVMNLAGAGSMVKDTVDKGVAVAKQIGEAGQRKMGDLNAKHDISGKADKALTTAQVAAVDAATKTREGWQALDEKHDISGKTRQAADAAQVAAADAAGKARQSWAAVDAKHDISGKAAAGLGAAQDALGKGFDALGGLLGGGRPSSSAPASEPTSGGDQTGPSSNTPASAPTSGGGYAEQR